MLAFFHSCWIAHGRPLLVLVSLLSIMKARANTYRQTHRETKAKEQIKQIAPLMHYIQRKWHIQL